MLTIMHPDGVAAGIRSESAQRQIAIGPEQVDNVVCRSQNQTSIERLQVYANAYYARLLECLRGEFPALAHALGQETFDGFGLAYLQSYPSTSYTLANLGRNFPRFLAETRPCDTADEESPSWPDFLIDLATVERTYSEVFDGPGIEDKRILQTEDLTAISPEQQSASFPSITTAGTDCTPRFFARLATFEWCMSRTETSHGGQAMLSTRFTVSSHTGQPALKISTLRSPLHALVNLTNARFIRWSVRIFWSMSAILRSARSFTSEHEEDATMAPA